jgi:hypothetical protein
MNRVSIPWSRKKPPQSVKAFSGFHLESTAWVPSTHLPGKSGPCVTLNTAKILIRLYPLHKNVFTVLSLSFLARQVYSLLDCRVYLAVLYQPSGYTSVSFVLKFFMLAIFDMKSVLMLTAVRTSDLILKYAFASSYCAGRYLPVRCL